MIYRKICTAFSSSNSSTVEPHYYGHPWDWASDLNGEVTVLQGANLHGGIQFGTEQR